MCLCGDSTCQSLWQQNFSDQRFANLTTTCIPSGCPADVATLDLVCERQWGPRPPTYHCQPSLW